MLPAVRSQQEVDAFQSSLRASGDLGECVEETVDVSDHPSCNWPFPLEPAAIPYGYMLVASRTYSMGSSRFTI